MQKVIETCFPLLAKANAMTRINNEVAEENRMAVSSDFDFEPAREASRQKLTPADRKTAINMLEQMGIKIVPMEQIGEALQEIL